MSHMGFGLGKMGGLMIHRSARHKFRYLLSGFDKNGNEVFPERFIKRTNYGVTLPCIDCFSEAVEAFNFSQFDREDFELLKEASYSIKSIKVKLISGCGDVLEEWVLKNIDRLVFTDYLKEDSVFDWQVFCTEVTWEGAPPIDPKFLENLGPPYSNKPEPNYEGYAWIKVPKYVMDESKSWEERYQELNAHHIQETTFLIEKVRELAELARKK